MKIFSIVFRTSLLVASIVMISVSAMAETISLTDKSEIQHAVAMNEAIDHLTEKVMSCIEQNNGKTEGCICANECSCKFKDAYVSTKKTFQRTINMYPNWEGNLVSYQKENDPQGYSINFAGLEHQFSTSCKK